MAELEGPSPSPPMSLSLSQPPPPQAESLTSRAGKLRRCDSEPTQHSRPPLMGARGTATDRGHKAPALNSIGSRRSGEGEGSGSDEVATERVRRGPGRPPGTGKLQKLQRELVACGNGDDNSHASSSANSGAGGPSKQPSRAASRPPRAQSAADDVEVLAQEELVTTDGFEGVLEDVAGSKWVAQVRAIVSTQLPESGSTCVQRHPSRAKRRMLDSPWFNTASLIRFARADQVQRPEAPPRELQQRPRGRGSRG